MNSYGNDLEGDYNFSRLLRDINALDGEFIIRFMTSHPKDCTLELLDTVAACDKTARHLHLPFQSGNNRVLERMNRGYTRERYEELIAYARKVMPDISLTSDVIVGFPGKPTRSFAILWRWCIVCISHLCLPSFIHRAKEPRHGRLRIQSPGRQGAVV